ncbi:MAG TPA: hypothetical protein VIS74_04905 [Chthoniobacterales bacterium]
MIKSLERFESAAALASSKQPPEDPREIEGYLANFQSMKLVVPRGGGFVFAPASEELRLAVDALEAAYNQRPVTLIRTIYALADHKIQSFADSFKIKES